MQDAVNNFIDQVAAKYSDKANHKIGIVEFGSAASVVSNMTAVDADGDVGCVPNFV